MLSGNRLQEEVIAREDAKIQRKRDQNEQRRLRILNAKARIMGLDVQGLDQQVVEKQQQRQREKEADIFARTQAMEIERFLANADEEERQMKAYQMVQIKKSWEETRESRKQQETTRVNMTDFDYDRCGAASALKFVGEDGSRKDRIRLQKDQMRRWIQEQVAEKAALRHLQKQEDMTYGEMIKAIDEIRANTEKEEGDLRKYIQKSVHEQNMEIAKQQERQNHSRNTFHDVTSTSLDLFNEDRTTAYNEQGRIIRVDMFKGFSEEQRKRILLENQNFIRARSDARDDEKQKDYEWMMQQVLALRAMEQAEYEEKCIRDMQDRERLDFLKTQMDEQAKDRKEWHKTKYGTVEAGFFDNFGTSCR